VQDGAEGFKKQNWRRKMKSIKNIIAAFVLATFLSVSTFAGDGILVGGKTGILVGGATAEPCTNNTAAAKDGIMISDATGILVGGFTGILVGGFTGILVGGITDSGNDTCGIMIGD
jgi:hypothetical protein